MKRNYYRIIHFIVLFIIFTMIVGALYVIKNLASTNFEELIYIFFSDSSNSDYSSLFSAIKVCLPIIFALTILFYKSFYMSESKICIFKHLNKYKKAYTIILFIVSILLICYSVHFFEYMINVNTSSDFIEENYIYPEEVNISFDQKRNLIVIFVESLENTLLSKEHGGNWNYDVIPELYDLIQNNDSTNFENSKGMKMIHGASWTSASIISNNTGVPFKTILNKSSYTHNLLPGSYALGDLLKDERISQ